ncbi:hypothetical protein QBC39DRAFT_344067 [Podospora conica]|nr:hypothetical protein QBC39DRAFT_344067 [Schizothecium conicum]
MTDTTFTTHTLKGPWGPHYHVQSIHNDKVSADDARLFTKSVTLSGPNAVSWTDAIGLVAPLLRCDSSWERFDVANDVTPAMLKERLHPCKRDYKIKPDFYPAPDGTPAYSLPSSASPTSMARPADTTPLDSFPTIPAEIRDSIWLALERPAMLKAYPFHIHSPTKGMKLIIYAPGTYPLAGDVDKALFRDWSDLSCAEICRESKEAVDREFGCPSPDSLPFRSSVDELRVVVDGEAASDGDGLYNHWSLYRGVRLEEQCNLDHPSDEARQACVKCTNCKLMADQDLPILIATARERKPPLKPEPKLVVPSAEFLSRIRRVTIDLANRDPKSNGEIWDWDSSWRPVEPHQARLRHQYLADALRRGLPNLSTLNILVEAMRIGSPHITRFIEPDYYYHSERVFLLSALTQMVKVRHANGCDGHPTLCRCLALPFPNLKELVVNVDTRCKLTYSCDYRHVVSTTAHFMASAVRDLSLVQDGDLPLESNVYSTHWMVVPRGPF